MRFPTPTDRPITVPIAHPLGHTDTAVRPDAHHIGDGVIAAMTGPISAHPFVVTALVLAFLATVAVVGVVRNRAARAAYGTHSDPHAAAAASVHPAYLRPVAAR